MDLPQIRNDLASLRQRVRKIFGVKLPWPFSSLGAEIAGIIEQSLTASDHVLLYAEGLEKRVQQLEKKNEQDE